MPARVIQGRDLFLAGADVVFGANIIPGTASRTTSGTFALTGANTAVLKTAGIAPDAVFAQIDGVTGGGLDRNIFAVGRVEQARNAG